LNNIWSEINWSQFGKQFNNFKQFPLPGQTGVTLLKNNKQIVNQKKSNKQSPANNQIFKENLNYLFNTPLPQEFQIVKLREAAGGMYFLDKIEEANNQLNSKPKMDKPELELKAYPCPKSLMHGIN
jgi:hypothetical protein